MFIFLVKFFLYNLLWKSIFQVDLQNIDFLLYFFAIDFFFVEVTFISLNIFYSFFNIFDYFLPHVFFEVIEQKLFIYPTFLVDEVIITLAFLIHFFYWYLGL